MNRWTGILFALAILCAGACHGKPREASVPKTWETLETAQASIRYPENWTVNQSGGLGLSFALYAEPDSPEDQFRENVSFMIQNLTGMGLDLDKFTDLSIKQIGTLLTNGQLEQSERLRKSGLPCHKLVYTFQMGIYSLKIVQYLWVIGDQAYLLSFVDQASEFDQKLDVATRILDSFELTGVRATRK